MWELHRQAVGSKINKIAYITKEMCLELKMVPLVRAENEVVCLNDACTV